MAKYAMHPCAVRNNDSAVPYKPYLLDESNLPPRQGRPRLAVFGGSFNPVHNGHLFLAGHLLRRRLADEVLFIPSGTHPLKPNEALAPAEQRLAMLKAALDPYPCFSHSDIEIQCIGQPSYTVETLETLKLAYPEHEVLFMMGMDCLAELHLWHRAQDLVAQNQFIVYPRSGVVQPKLTELSDHFGPKGAIKLLEAVIEAPLLPASASQIRGYAAAGSCLAGLVPAGVEQHIAQHRLYASPPPAPPAAARAGP
jgi:nicotinate-nucleotide adenylyltransferase